MFQAGPPFCICLYTQKVVLAIIILVVSQIFECSLRLRYLYIHVCILYTLQSASKERLARSVKVAVTVPLVLVAIRSAAGVFVRKGRLGTNVTKVPTVMIIQNIHVVSVTTLFEK